MKLSDYEKIRPAGSVLFREGEASDRLFLLQKGKIHLFKSRGEKRLLQKVIIGSGLFGLEEFLLGAPFTEEAQAAEESIVLELPRHLAESYLLANPKFLLQLSEFLARRNCNLEKSAFLSKKSEGARLASALWLAFSESGGAEVVLSPEEAGETLAAVTGAAPAVISEFLLELERLEIIGSKSLSKTLSDSSRAESREVEGNEVEGKSDRGFFLKSAEKLFRYAEYLEDKEHFG